MVLAVASLGAFGFVRARRQEIRAGNERAASAALKLLASAEADFRANDRDANRIQDFWTGDVRSLHDLIPVKGSEPIRLIPKEIAEADPSHPDAKPYRGYWIVAMDKDEVLVSYRQDTKGVEGTGAEDRNPSKFGFSAYPAEYGGTGTATFTINEGNTVFKEDLGGKPRLCWPTDNELKAHYAIID
jgi:hypothetical protein